ncbi:hypothetical protein [Xanthomonas sacchari]|uniref:hypothetical protein n=1 Tax=Xanthomonas TaxID=338 RepID=UPI00225E37D8|nr:hypothetical protein [Xanthomonas sacchari]
MLFPTNPDKRPELWGKFVDKVAANTVSFVVHDGRMVTAENQKKQLNESVDEIVNSFRSAGIVRFGSNRGHVIGPFFAFSASEGVARLVEYAIDPGIHSFSNGAMQEALQSVAINLFFEQKEIEKIALPFYLSHWEVGEWSVATEAGKTVLHRKNL